MGKKRILAVDDNTVNLATLEKELQDKYEVIPMISGRRAIKYLYTEKVDLILLDVQMPLMDGVQTLREIRTQENGITVPVIFLTANKDKETVLEGSKLGIMDYITKPFDIQDLTERIDKVFKRLGVMPIEDEELYRSILAILKDAETNRVSRAIAKCNEVLRYQIDDDIAGRMRNAKNKLEMGNIPAAVLPIKRVLRMLESKMGMEEALSGSSGLSNQELKRRLSQMLSKIADFQTKDAIDIAKGIRKYPLEDDKRMVLQQIVELLEDYDDEKAEVLIHTLLRTLDQQ